MPFTLKNRDRIISAVKSRVINKTHKFGIDVPRSIEHAKQLHAKNGDTLWNDAIAKEIYQVLVAFEILEDGESLPPIWKN